MRKSIQGLFMISLALLVFLLGSCVLGMLIGEVR